MDPTGARPRLFSNTGIPHLADEGLAERADGVLGAGDILAAFTASEAVVINRSTGLHHAIPFAPDAAAISLQGDYVTFGGTGILLVDANGTSEVIRGTETHDGFDLLTFSKDGRWLWALSSSYGEASLSQIDVEKRQLLNRRKISDQLGSYSSVLADHSALLFPLDDGRVQVIPLVPKE